MSDSSFSLTNKVDKCRDVALKIRLQTLITSKGLKESRFYKSLGLNKDYWYRLSWGLQDCPLHLKIKISQALGTDSSLIFQKGDGENDS